MHALLRLRQQGTPPTGMRADGLAALRSALCGLRQERCLQDVAEPGLVVVGVPPALVHKLQAQVGAGDGPDRVRGFVDGQSGTEGAEALESFGDLPEIAVALLLTEFLQGA